jgi:hypothetical protein
VARDALEWTALLGLHELAVHPGVRRCWATTSSSAHRTSAGTAAIRCWPTWSSCRSSRSRPTSARACPCSSRCAIRPAGRAATPAGSPAGRLRVGDEVVALPSGERSRVARIETPAGDVDAAAAPYSVAVALGRRARRRAR